VANLDHVFIVTYKSHADKSTSSYLALLFSRGRSEREQVCFGHGDRGGVPRTVRRVARHVSYGAWRAPSRLTTCGCRWDIGHEKSPRSELH
jgi:hypothetical protein